MTEPRSVAVLGSCITRDNFNSRFNADYKRWYKVGATTNQSSMIALMSPPVDEPWEAVRPMKAYGLWNVGSDLSREILDLLAEEPPDLLVLDFFGDVHFGVLRMADGRYLTNNRWRIHKTDLYQRLIADDRTTTLSWQVDEEAYLAVWVEAMDRFAAYVAEHCPRTRVIVHCGFNATEVMRPGKARPARLRAGSKEARQDASGGNAFWARLNEHARTSYGWDHIALGHEWYASFTEHPWGPFEVHYTMDYYHRFLAELHRLALRDQLPAEARDRLDAIAEASADRVRVELARLREALAKAGAPAEPEPSRRWRSLLRRRSGPAPAPLPDVGGRDHELLEDLRGTVDEATFERAAQLPASADEHVAMLREVWEARISHKQDKTSQ